MKKKIFGGIALSAIAATAAWNVSLNSQSHNLSGFSLANAEALADGEYISSNGAPYYCCGSSENCYILVQEGLWSGPIYVLGSFRVAPC
jgi:hypothetical protein